MIFELFFGGITHHYIASQLNYCNVINKSVGTIKHGYGAILIGNEKNRGGIIVGKDSACGNIYGGLGSFSSFKKNLNLIVGAYNVNRKEFYDRKITPFSVFGVTPIAGLNYKLPLYKKTYKKRNLKISFDTIVSLGIITHGLSVTF